MPICPIQAKYDGSVHAAKAEALGAKILAQALATHVEIGDDRRVSGIRVRRSDGTEFLAVGRYYVVACHAIETPRLLLNSKSDRTPGGVANSSDAVGRYLLSQLNQDCWGITVSRSSPSVALSRRRGSSSSATASSAASMRRSAPRS